MSDNSLTKKARRIASAGTEDGQQFLAVQALQVEALDVIGNALDRIAQSVERLAFGSETGNRPGITQALEARVSRLRGKGGKR